MAFLSLSVNLSPSPLKTTPFSPTSSPSATSSTSYLLPPPLFSFHRTRAAAVNLRGKSLIVRMAPDEEKMTRRSPLDFPIEWERPKPARRPDIFPQFSPMKTPLPTPMPADPPEEDEEDEDEKKEKEDEEEEDQENPEEEKPDDDQPL